MAFCCRPVTDNCTAIVLSIAILLSGLQVASSAPTGEIKWWKNPCDRHIALRHGRSTAENQLNRFLHKMNTTFFRDIKLMYKFTDNERFKGTCPKIKNVLFPIKQASSLHFANKAFYYTLEQFAEFLEKLKDTPITAEGNFNVTRRKTNFERAEQNLKLLMCEYNETIKENENSDAFGAKNKPTKHNAEPSEISKDCLPASMDESHARYADMDFFKKLQKFLRQSRRILMKKKKKGGNKKSKDKSAKVVRNAKGGKRTKKRTL